MTTARPPVDLTQTSFAQVVQDLIKSRNIALFRIFEIDRAIAALEAVVARMESQP